MRTFIAALTMMLATSSLVAANETTASTAAASARFDSIQDAVTAIATASDGVSAGIGAKDMTATARASRDAALAAEQAAKRSDEVNVKLKKNVREHATKVHETAVKILRAAEKNEAEELTRQSALLSQHAASLQELVNGRKAGVVSSPSAGSTASSHDHHKAASATAQAATALREVGNANCPISGHAVGSMQKGSHINYEGYRVGLCCDSCQSTFLKDPKKYLQAAMEEKK